MTNTLYFGDNLNVLRDHIADASVDLVYLDPPFNSKRDYNLLFKSAKGHRSEAQITAFEDSWHWGEEAEREFDELRHQSNTDVAEMMVALRAFLGMNDMMAYLVMMANRLLELHRVLKPTGSLYLHCDPTASHYLKIVLDGVFGHEFFRNEIIWKRSNPKSLQSINLPTCTDTILRYSKTSKCTFHQPFAEHDPDYVRTAYRLEDEKGHFQLLPLLNPNDNRPNLTYEFLGVKRVWRWTKKRMEKAYADGLVIQAKPGAVPRYKKYLDDSLGRTVTNCWTDIAQVSEAESLGYPTQKPVKLLERIIAMSSNEGDVVLDPFCGCGTATHAAQLLGRRWIGIDITHLAITLIEKRLRDAFPGITFDVEGTPKDIEGARDLARRDKYQFQWWALSLIGAQPYQNKKKGTDRGIDGLILFPHDQKTTAKIIVSVKGGENIRPTEVRDLVGVLQRESGAIGVYETLNPPSPAMVREALSAGYYESPLYPGRRFRMVQILTIEGLLDGVERLDYPDASQGRDTFKRAAVERPRSTQTPLLPE